VPADDAAERRDAPLPPAQRVVVVVGSVVLALAVIALVAVVIGIFV
jgi:hypothetical protein